MQSNPSVKSNTRSLPMPTRYPVLKSISKDGSPSFTLTTTTR